MVTIFLNSSVSIFFFIYRSLRKLLMIALDCFILHVVSSRSRLDDLLFEGSEVKNRLAWEATWLDSQIVPPNLSWEE